MLKNAPTVSAELHDPRVADVFRQRRPVQGDGELRWRTGDEGLHHRIGQPGDRGRDQRRGHAPLRDAPGAVLRVNAAGALPKAPHAASLSSVRITGPTRTGTTGGWFAPTTDARRRA